MKTNLVLLLVLLSVTIFSQGKMRVEHTASGDLTFNYVYTGVFTVYDLQSNGTPQQIWQDPNNPLNVHAVFLHSDHGGVWSDRNGRYFFSSDMGLSWNDLGSVQVSASARGGFPAVTGLDDGRPVIGLQTNDSMTATRTQIYVRNSQGTGWLRFDPLSSITGDPRFPRVLGIGNDKVFFASVSDRLCLNSLDIPSGEFSGWNCSAGSVSYETYKLAEADDGTLGLVYIGDITDSLTFGNLYYMESNDLGLTWSSPIQIFQYEWGGDSMGTFRGVDMIFLGNEPYVVFETAKQDFAAQTCNDTLPNKIMLWSPSLNGGMSFVLAESGVDIPFYHQYVFSHDSFLPVCRPAIGKSAAGDALFVVMNAVTEFYWEDFNSFFAGHIMYSLDGGLSWTTPQKFTPAAPLKDWRYVSISPVNAVSTDGNCHLQMVMQADTIPGSAVNNPFQITMDYAEFVGITTTVSLVSVNDLNKIPVEFYLSRNFPNPFNPSTTISYSISTAAEVNISVYNLLGEKIKEAVNEFKQPGSYELKLNMEAYNSGVYFYKMQSGSFVETKKMILIK